MTRKARKALRLSIKHWDRLTTGTQKRGEGPNGDDCPLCAEYRKSERTLCEGCPVREHTGEEFCEGTPWRNAMHSWINHGPSPQFQAAAKIELEFLRSLLPKK